MHHFLPSIMALLPASLSLFFAYSPLYAGVFPERPDVLVCSVEDAISAQPWDKFVFYVSGRLEDGGVLYKSLTSNPVLVTITAEGRVWEERLRLPTKGPQLQVRARFAKGRLRLRWHSPIPVDLDLHLAWGDKEAVHRGRFRDEARVAVTGRSIESSGPSATTGRPAAMASVKAEGRWSEDNGSGRRCHSRSG